MEAAQKLPPCGIFVNVKIYLPLGCGPKKHLVLGFVRWIRQGDFNEAQLKGILNVTIDI